MRGWPGCRTITSTPRTWTCSASGSLFELLSTARTTAGETTLAGWLLAPAPPAVVVERQAAARDLAAREAFREDLAVLGPEIRCRRRFGGPRRLGAASRSPAPPGWGPVLLVALSATSLAGLVLWTLDARGAMPVWLPIAALLQGAVGLAWRRRVLASIRELEPRAHDLAVVAAALARVEHETFDAPRFDRAHAPGWRRPACRRRARSSGCPGSSTC